MPSYSGTIELVPSTYLQGPELNEVNAIAFSYERLVLSDHYTCCESEPRVGMHVVIAIANAKTAPEITCLSEIPGILDTTYLTLEHMQSIPESNQQAEWMRALSNNDVTIREFAFHLLLMRYGSDRELMSFLADQELSQVTQSRIPPRRIESLNHLLSLEMFADVNDLKHRVLQIELSLLRDADSDLRTAAIDDIYNVIVNDRIRVESAAKNMKVADRAQAIEQMTKDEQDANLKPECQAIIKILNASRNHTQKPKK